LLLGVLVGLILSFTIYRETTFNFIKNTPQLYNPTDLIIHLDENETQILHGLVQKEYSDMYKEAAGDLETTLFMVKEKSEAAYEDLLRNSTLQSKHIYESGWNLFKHKIPLWIFFIALLGLCVWSYRKNLSLIPMLGLVSCLYMMCELTVWNWLYFRIWLIIVLVISFSYSRFHSKLNK